jgi:hypothetical protein
MKRLRLGLGLFVLPGLLGCPNVEPCNSIEDGDTLELTLQTEVEEYIDYKPLPSCEGVDQPPKKARLKMSNGEERGGCVVAGCPTDFPSPSEPLFGGPVPGGSYVCERMGRKVNLDGCEARRDVVIRSLSGDDFFSPSSKVVLIRRIGYGLGSACPKGVDDETSHRCSDAWIVRLERK